MLYHVMVMVHAMIPVYVLVKPMSNGPCLRVSVRTSLHVTQKVLVIAKKNACVLAISQVNIVSSVSYTGLEKTVICIVTRF